MTSNTIARESEHYRELEPFHDRCDRCSAQAFFRSIKIVSDGFLELLFCGHHARTHGKLLEAQGWLIQNNTDKINVKPALYEE